MFEITVFKGLTKTVSIVYAQEILSLSVLAILILMAGTISNCQKNMNQAFLEFKQNPTCIKTRNQVIYAKHSWIQSGTYNDFLKKKHTSSEVLLPPL